MSKKKISPEIKRNKKKWKSPHLEILSDTPYFSKTESVEKIYAQYTGRGGGTGGHQVGDGRDGWSRMVACDR